jgi:hypothetical protein
VPGCALRKRRPLFGLRRRKSELPEGMDGHVTKNHCFMSMRQNGEVRSRLLPCPAAFHKNGMVNKISADEAIPRVRTAPRTMGGSGSTTRHRPRVRIRDFGPHALLLSLLSHCPPSSSALSFAASS